MFTYAFITVVQLGVLDEKTYGPAARRGWLALLGYLDENANLREVCAGTGIRADRKHYLKRPRITGDFHGHAPLLWCAAALLRQTGSPQRNGKFARHAALCRAGGAARCSL